MPLTFTFALSQNQSFELRCNYGTRRLDTDKLASLINLCEEKYYSQALDDTAQLRSIGRELYSWLDGKEGWLRRALDEIDEARIYLDLIQTSEAQDLNHQTQRVALGLAHLPWELLHDGHGFLLQRQDAPLPVRSIQQRNKAVLGVANRPLQLLFMATSPEHPGIAPLEFEQEEVNILQATKEQPLALIVEESGSVIELGNLVQSYAEDYFDVFHLTGHGVIYTEDEFGRYLPQGRRIKDYTPCFITEDDEGKVQFSTVDDLARAFRGRFPRVVFLSGCHTGQTPNRGTVPSMAQALVKAGAGVVLGWARPVFDKTGIIAAQALYQALATGATVEDAVRVTQQEMIAQECSDWHLLRIYRDSSPIRELVTQLNTKKREKLKFTPPENEFLDENNIVKVASRGEFVGRRRALQRGMRALKQTSDYIGVFIAGMGGLGKSSLAARLCTRLQSQRPNFERVVLIGVVDEVGLINKLASKYERYADVPTLLNQPGISFKGRLQNFFEAIEQEHDKPLLLVLDDFEQNIPQANVADGSLRMTAEAYRVLEALCAALAENQAESRLIVTCRYLQAETLPPHRLHLEQLKAMSEADIDKIYWRLDQDVRLQVRKQRILKIADGNPRLLKWLVEVVQLPNLAADELLTKLEGVQLKFREDILAATLLNALADEEKKFLAQLSVFRLPVKEDVIQHFPPTPPTPVPPSLVGKGFRGLGFLPKLISLSLVESATTYAQQTPEYRVTTILAPLLQPLLTEEEWQTTHQAATQIIYRSWWEEVDNRNEEQAREIVRLAILAQEKEIAVSVGNSLARNWVNSSRFVETRELCEEILQLGEDYRIFGTIARAEHTLGFVNKALTHYEQALQLCPEDDLREKAAILHQMAGLKAQQGDITGALTLYQQSLDIEDSINNVQGKAATLHQMAGLKAQQGDITGALTLYQQSLDITETINNVQGKAATLHQMAGLKAQQGDITGALTLYQQSLDIKETINDVQGKAATLHEMAGLKAQQGDITGALALYQQSLDITETINYVQGKAMTLMNMAYCEGKRANKTKQLELNLQAAQLLGQIRAYIDLRTVLSNLGVTVESNGVIYLAQAVWLCWRIEAPLDDTINTLDYMYRLLPKGDEMEALLGAFALYLCQVRGDGHPQLQELQERSLRILTGVATAQGIETQEAFYTWVEKQRLNNPNYFIPRLLELLEAIVGDEWLFERF
ncbi:TPR repeat-containing protein [Nostoc sp. NIES-3756]|uniref:tetratricopeptide repeat protein n=1 Tax=Nostoc sp. NIES-3756 TaxID=1751286 RepID=UPI0007215163|nr:tetratricopeptide repeat protein [Nostoc sp. NIES-3756]BAT53298.1 TPR repeat-containing protein [Nostoc sp. NIES-3756]